MSREPYGPDRAVDAETATVLLDGAAMEAVETGDGRGRWVRDTDAGRVEVRLRWSESFVTHASARVGDDVVPLDLVPGDGERFAFRPVTEDYEFAVAVVPGGEA